MNRYIVPICDPHSFPYIKTITANSLESAEEKLMMEIEDLYDIDVPEPTYYEYCCYCSERYNILIGDLYDIDEL